VRASDWLILITGNVTHVSFPFEVQRGTVIVHPDQPVSAHNGATLVPGKVGNGVQLEGGGEYVTLGDQGKVCMGNLELCQHGMMISFYLKLRRMQQDSYVLSSGSYSVYTKNNKVRPRDVIIESSNCRFDDTIRAMIA
jgi:hypothetical protein